MRKIKFRAWYPFKQGGGKMLEHNRIKLEFRKKENRNEVWLSGIGDDALYCWSHHNEAKVMQWTGLTDKNGVDVFEGDILEFDRKEWGGDDNIHLVSWDKDEAQFSFGGGVQSHDMEFRTVIGNIHEHPNLLK